MSAGGCDLEGASREELTADVGQVWEVWEARSFR